MQLVFVHVISVALLISVAQINGQTQAEVNAVARSDFARADADLNKTYQSVLAKLGDPESKQKLKETQRAWVTSDDAVLIKGNLADAYLFDNQFDKAKALYPENQNAKISDERSFIQMVLDDFKELQEAGITHPDIEKIKALLTVKTNAP